MKIWDDKCIPRIHSHKVLSPKVSSGRYHFVPDLIDLDLRVWKVNSLIELFESHQVEMIKSIPISIGGGEVN